ncbi:sulfurtransferase complex subunit TusD [Shewanella schlegeliana]|uniref:Sulfurtransferase complex subunit TusD n=1 Tax=Shewanella schlegeliana TaxID=190308 RepID=A0ABS1SZI8_9GAMM|nr:sulfurtransferase complex subunit TusD [Shewanella schlegeliana]MBL4913943.1 sulfurtransferase complex subunit TusD [Shewanella schlegeliana]MCL1108673.1 sulfurtransferase complex subunit TusD [Shewanella schlegeliana]GIU26549.1 sulfurtransferase TusD [Shewanella schlegeliana]
MSKFIIQVNSAAYGSASSYSAYRFAKAAIENGHTIEKVFFYQDGVLNTNHLNSPASDEFDLKQAWVELHQLHGVALVNCVSAALRRGVLSESEAKENQYSHWNMQAPFTMGGLGELVIGIETADRLVSF